MTMLLLLAALAAPVTPAATPTPTPAPAAKPGSAAVPAFAVTEIAPGVFAAISNPSDESTLGNAGFVVGSDGVLVVDAFATPAAAETLYAEIRARTPLPVRFLVLTHFHRDHMGGAAVFAKAGAAVVAHENVRAWAHREFQTDLTAAERARYSALRLPDVTYRDRLSLWLGDRRIDVLHFEGHSGSDSIVRVPDAKVVFAGDLFSNHAIPGTAFARTDLWVATLDTLLRTYPDATFVPGHGPVGRPLDVRGFRDYVSALRLAVARAIQEGKSGAALVEAVKAQLAVRHRSWTWFEEVGGNVEDTERELNGTKAFPPAPPP